MLVQHLPEEGGDTPLVVLEEQEIVEVKAGRGVRPNSMPM